MPRSGTSKTFSRELLLTRIVRICSLQGCRNRTNFLCRPVETLLPTLARRQVPRPVIICARLNARAHARAHAGPGPAGDARRGGSERHSPTRRDAAQLRSPRGRNAAGELRSPRGRDTVGARSPSGQHPTGHGGGGGGGGTRTWTKWTEQEEDALREAVEAFAAAPAGQRWALVHERMAHVTGGTRTVKQVRPPAQSKPCVCVGGGRFESGF